MTVYYWARWLADALRADPWLAPRVIEVDGWRDRGRPPTQFAFLPTGVVEHHTACMARIGHDPQACLNGILAGNTDAPGPISQLLGTFTPPGVKWTGGNADPRILVVAAGRSNHAGAGSYPWGAPAGNGSSLGVEWCGPPADGWPDVVVECRERVTAAILRHNGWSTHQVCTHAEYAPTRKIDPSGRWRSEPTLAQLTRWTPGCWRDAVDTELVRSFTAATTTEDDMANEYLVHYPAKPASDGTPPKGWTLLRMVGLEAHHIGGPFGEWLPELRKHSAAELVLRTPQAFAAWVQRIRPVGACPEGVPDAVRHAWQERAV